MNFLYPGFLFSLLAIAIPIVIHLFNFRKYKKIYFSNVHFLKEAKEQGSSTEKLRHKLILCSRILAVAFLVLAFSRPFIPSDDAVQEDLTDVISIYVDNSYSMETVNQEGNLLDEAKRRAKEIVKGYQVNDRFRLLTNDFEGRHQRLLSGEEFNNLLDEVKISSFSRKLQQVMNRQLEASPGRFNRFNYLISDFQQNFVGNRPLKKESDVHISFIKLNANPLPNLAVDSVWFLSPLHKPGDREQLVVQIRNYSDQEAADVQVNLRVNQQQRSISRLNIPAAGIKKDTLSFSGLKSGWQKATVSLKDYPVTFDDQLNFAFKVEADMNVLSIYGTDTEKYVKTLFSADPYFKLREMPESNIKYTGLSDYKLIVLNGLKAPSSGLAASIEGYLKSGGSVVIFPDLDGDMNQYSRFLNALSLPSVQRLKQETLQVSSIDLKNDLFKDVFEQIPKTIDLPKVKRYFQFTTQNRSNRIDILQLPPDEIFFAQYRLGSGKVFLSATDLDVKDSDLPLHPVFLPLMYKIAFGSAGFQPLYYTLGKDDLLESAKIRLSPNQFLKLVSKDMEVIPEVRQIPGSTLLYIADQVKRPDFYNLNKADSLLSIFAFNENRKESDMKYASEQTLKRLYPDKKVSVYDLRKDKISTSINLKNNSTELWKLCIVLCAVFLGVEILLIRFFNKKKNYKLHESST